METISKERNFDSIIKFFSLIYVLLITTGLVYNYFFYKTFGLTITEYIDLGEVIILFTPMLTDYFIVFFLLFAVIMIVFRKTFYFQTQNPIVLKERLKLKKWVVITFIFLCTVSLVFYLMSIQHKPFLRTSIMFLIMGNLMCAPIIIEFIFDWFEKNMDISVPKEVRDIIYILVVFLTITIWSLYSRVEKIKRKGWHTNFIIVYKNGDPNLKSDSATYYLGRTNKYIFIYDFIMKSSTVINVEDVKEFVVIDKENQ